MILNPIKYPNSTFRSAADQLAVTQFEKLIQEIHRMELPPEVIVELNIELEKLELQLAFQKKFYKQIKTSKAVLLKILYHEVGVVPINHYRDLWIALGLSGIGIPLGIFLSFFMDNSSAIALGIALGCSMGIVIGANLDNQAEAEGRQMAIRL